MRTNRRRSSIGVSIVFAIVGTIMVIVAAVIAINEQQFIRTATHVTGTVIQLVSHGDGHGNTSYMPEVQFTTTDERQITYTSNISSNPPAYSVGQEVDIYYDPANPHSVVIGGQTGLISLIIGGIGALFAVLGVGILALRLIFGR